MLRLVTAEEAKIVAEILLRDGRICGVEIFGSIARTGNGRDIDLILLVQSRTIATEFVIQTKAAIEDEIALRDALGTLEGSMVPSPHLAYDFNLREKVAIKILGKGFKARLERAHESLLHKIDRQARGLDLFILPLSWREEIRLLEQGFPQGDPDFWQNLKKDAILLMKNPA